MTDTIELLTTRGGLRLTKPWRADGTIGPYSAAKWLARETATVRDLGELSALLRTLETRPGAALIRGRYLGDERRASDPEPDAATAPEGLVRKALYYFEDQPLHALCLDIDSFAPMTCDPVLDAGGAVAEFIATAMPAEFHGAGHHWQLSAGAGHPTKPGLRAHVWFWLAEPLTSSQAKAWAQSTGAPIDIALMQPTQWHYTAAPVFAPGVADPAPVRSGFVDGPPVRLALDAAALASCAPERVVLDRPRDLADSADPHVAALFERGLVLRELPGKGLAVRCPNEAKHSGPSGGTEAVYFPAGVGGRTDPGFKCQHAHCDHVTATAALERWGINAPADGFDVVTPEAVAEAVAEAAAAIDRAMHHPVALDWATMPDDPEPPVFVIPGWMPDNVVTLFAAHGGTGKSYLSIYVAICLAFGRHPFASAGAPEFIPRRRVVLYSAEDDVRTLQFRFAQYAKLMGIDRRELTGWLLVLDATECDNVLFAGDEKVGGRTTKRFDWLARTVQGFGADVLIFDTAADALDANENDRARVRQFMSALKRLAPAVLLLAHVDAASSMADPALAKGYSGSTAWHNSARSRWFMSRAADSEDIVLTLPKANYAKAGREAVIRWSDEHKLFAVQSVRSGRAKAADHRRGLLAAVRDAVDAGESVSAAPNAANAAWCAIKDSAPRGLKMKDFAAEVRTWRADGLATIEEYRRANRTPGRRLVLTAAGRALCEHAGADSGDL